MTASAYARTFHLGPDILNALDLQQNLAVYWVEDANRIPYYERGSPLSALLSLWMGARQRYFVHAGAVGNANGGVLLTGKGGAGKSTIVNLLLRFYDPQHGAILLDGEPLPSFKLESYHRKIGVVSQDTFLFNNTVKFNIAFSAIATPSDEQIIAAAKKAGAHEFIMELPNGYDTFVGDRGVKLSGGQRQRISIARAILRDPEILILDEATSALDAKTERRIYQAILELSQGRTVIIIAHRLSTIKNADQIIVLKNGQVAEIGGREELLERGGEYYQLAQAQ
jgi:subfamily B ATP-binding cassette protein MsbA